MIVGGFASPGHRVLSALVMLKLLITIELGEMIPRTPIHPGEILKEEMDALNLSSAELARTINVPANRISQIVSGKRNIFSDTASPIRNGHKQARIDQD